MGLDGAQLVQRERRHCQINVLSGDYQAEKEEREPGLGPYAATAEPVISRQV
jgi:hypothetical protein